MKRSGLCVLALLLLAVGYVFMGGQSECSPTIEHTQYVMDQINVPTTMSEAQQYGLVLDGNVEGNPNNALGVFLAAVNFDDDYQETTDKQVAHGEIINLMDLGATSLVTDPDARNWVFLGDNPTPAPCIDENDEICGQHLNGDGSFEIAPGSPENPLLPGMLEEGRFIGGPGEMTIEIPLPHDETVNLDLVGARMEIEQVTESSMTNGKFGGGVSQEDVEEILMPAIHQGIENIISLDCTGEPVDCPGPDCRPCGCTPGGDGRLLLDLFDEYGATPEDDPDCMVTLEEFMNNSLVASLVAPDVDLLDCSSGPCVFGPGIDGVQESLSLGFGFSAVSGTFAWMPPIN